MMMRQYKLKNFHKEMVCWLEAGKVKKGDCVTLKNSENPKDWWLVEEVYTKMDLAEIKGGHESYKWHKNDFHGKLEGLVAFKKVKAS